MKPAFETSCRPGIHPLNWLRAGRSGDRIPVGARFSAPVQTGPGVQPASSTMDTGSFPGVKSGRSVTLTSHPFQCRGHGRVELYLYSPYGPYGLYRTSVPVQGCNLPLYTPLKMSTGKRGVPISRAVFSWRNWKTIVLNANYKLVQFWQYTLRLPERGGAAT